MPRRPGTSHSIVALLAIISGSYLTDLVKLYVNAQDILRAINNIPVLLVQQSLVGITPEKLSFAIVASTVAISSSIWGVGISPQDNQVMTTIYHPVLVEFIIDLKQYNHVC
ncbi:hypothetical protein [Haloferax volcanii]|uniref:hypothetical protein n=1 Tax=Haloferax volcanii TaxID=2246 RepID=UPI00349FA8C6